MIIKKCLDTIPIEAQNILIQGNIKDAPGMRVCLFLI